MGDARDSTSSERAAGPFLRTPRPMPIALFRQGRVYHPDDAPDLEAYLVGIGFLKPRVVGGLIIDDNDAEQLLLGSIGA